MAEVARISFFGDGQRSLHRANLVHQLSLNHKHVNIARLWHGCNIYLGLRIRELDSEEAVLHVQHVGVEDRDRALDRDLVGVCELVVRFCGQLQRVEVRSDGKCDVLLSVVVVRENLGLV